VGAMVAAQQLELLVVAVLVDLEQLLDFQFHNQHHMLLQ